MNTPGQLRSSGAAAGAPSTDRPPAAGEAVDPNVPESVVPNISGVPGESPAPPSTAGISTPPEWYDDLAGAPEESLPGDPGPTMESIQPADVAPPDVGVDPEWWSGPEAEPENAAPEPPDATDPVGQEPADHEPGIFDDPSPSPATDEAWAPPTTPNADFGTTDDASPTAGPTPFVAPGTDPRVESPSTPQVNPMPPPQWDQARNTYIQWDPSQQMWLQWDTRANRWKLIDT